MLLFSLHNEMCRDETILRSLLKMIKTSNNLCRLRAFFHRRLLLNVLQK